MKKYLLMFLTLGLIFTLAACNDNKKEDEDIFKPVFYGLFNTTIEEGDAFDPMAGVTAEDNVDGDLTSEVKVNGEVNVNKPGTYIIEYEVEDSAGNFKSQLRQITVDYKFGFGKTYNGDFSDGLNKWSSWFGEGGSGSVTVVEGVLQYKADSIGNQFWATQFNQTGIGLETGKTYEVTFKAKADIARKMQVKMEQGDNYADVTFDLTTEWDTYKFTIEMGEKDTNENAKLNFFIGKIVGEDPATTVYLDDITLSEVTAN